MIELSEAKEYARIDINEDDQLLQKIIIPAAVEYLKNATGKDYPLKDASGNAIDYILEKIYLQLLISYWYEERAPVGKVGEDFTYMTKSIMLQLQNK